MPQSYASQYDGIADAYIAAQDRHFSTMKDGAGDAIRDRLDADLRGYEALDAGCGAGWLARTLHERGARTYGIDASAALIAVAAARSHPEIRLTIGRFEAMPYDDAAFDLIVSRYALHYADDLPAALAECARVLKPGGRLVASVSHELFCAQFLSGNEVILPCCPDAEPVRFPMRGKADYLAAAERSGFRVIGCDAGIPLRMGNMTVPAPTFQLFDLQRLPPESAAG